MAASTNRLRWISQLFTPSSLMRGYVHSTWAHTYACRPLLFYRPTTIEDLRTIVHNARRNAQTITVVGSGHSPSTLTMTTSVLVNLDNLDKVLEIKNGKGYSDIIVQAGIRLYQLNEYLATKNLALQNLGSISDQSIAGVISTGTHGSSAYHGLISEQIVELKLMIMDGSIVTCSDTINHDLFKAALLSFGKMGIIVEATVRTVPAFNLQAVQQVADFDEFLSSDWHRFFIDAEFHRIWWYPYSRKLVLWSASRTELPAEPVKTSFYGTKLGRFLYEFLLWCTVKIYPKWTPSVERWLFRNQFAPIIKGGPAQTIQRSDEAMNMDCLFSQFVDEWSLPLTNGLTTLRRLDEAIQRQAFYVHAPIEIRVSNTTLPSEPLSTRHGAVVGQVPNVGPIYGNISRPYLDPSPKLPYAHPPDITAENLTVNLNATMYRPFGCNSETRDWFRTFEDICESQGGKPHWAKNFIGKSPSHSTKHHMNGVHTQIEQWYGDDLEAWKSLRQKYDPDGVFVGNKRWLQVNGLL